MSYRLIDVSGFDPKGITSGTQVSIIRFVASHSQRIATNRLIDWMMMTRIFSLLVSVLIIPFLWPHDSASQSPALLDSFEQYRALYRDGKYREAIPLAERAVRLGEKEFKPDDERLAVLTSDLGALYTAQGRYEEGRGPL